MPPRRLTSLVVLLVAASPTHVRAQGAEPDDYGVPGTTDDTVAPAVAQPPASSATAGAAAPMTSDDDGDEVVIIDDGEDGDEDDDAIVIDDGSADNPAESPGLVLPTIGAGRTWMSVDLSSRFMMDSNFDSKTREDVAEWWNVGRLRLDYRAGPSLRAVAEAWVRWGVTGEDTKPLHDFALFNARNPKWTGDVQLREGYVTLSGWGVDLKVGQRIFVWGKNETYSPADVMNPLDVRYDPLAALSSTKDGKAPIFAVDAAYSRGDSTLQLVVAPFFTSQKMFLFGRDFSLAAPGTDMRAQLQALGAVHPSIEDQLQTAVSGTEVPDESFDNVSVAVRAKTSLSGWDFAATAYFGWDRTPQLDFDPDLAVIAQRAPDIIADPNVLIDEPELRATALRVQQRAAVGEELVSATYNRLWVFALEGEGVIGDFVLRADLGFSPQQTYYDSALHYHFLPTFSGALGGEYTRGEEWFAALSGIVIAAFDAPGDAILAGLEPVDLDPSTRDVTALVAGAATVRYLWESQNVQFQVAAIYAFIPGDFVFTGEIAYKDWEPHVFEVGGVYITGPENEVGTLGQTFQRNDFLYVQYEGSW